MEAKLEELNLFKGVGEHYWLVKKVENEVLLLVVESFIHLWYCCGAI